MKLVKDCEHRQKNGRCKKWHHYCCFSPNTAVICIANKPQPKKQGRKKR